MGKIMRRFFSRPDPKRRSSSGLKESPGMEARGAGKGLVTLGIWLLSIQRE